MPVVEVIHNFVMLMTRCSNKWWEFLHRIWLVLLYQCLVIFGFFSPHHRCDGIQLPGMLPHIDFSFDLIFKPRKNSCLCSPLNGRSLPIWTSQKAIFECFQHQFTNRNQFTAAILCQCIVPCMRLFQGASERSLHSIRDNFWIKFSLVFFIGYFFSDKYNDAMIAERWTVDQRWRHIPCTDGGI